MMEGQPDHHDGNPSHEVELPKLDRRRRLSFFRPQIELTSTSSGGSGRSSVLGGRFVLAPEKKLTLFALHLAILEKLASGIGTLTFIWATVVLLGGFATSLKSIDFWFVTGILFSEGTRIFSRSHELEWQHYSSAVWTLGDESARSFRAIISVLRSFVLALIFFFLRRNNDDSGSRQLNQLQQMDAAEAEGHASGNAPRTWYAPDVPLLPYVGWAFVSRHVSRAFGWLQLSSAAACIGLSLARLVSQDYVEGADDSGGRNKGPSLNVFYAGALAEALMFLMEKAYWTWRISYNKLLENVSWECELGSAAGVVSVRRFFYESYTKCIDGSIFDGLRMDLVNFAKDLLDSEFRDEQLMGIRILDKFTNSPRFSFDTLRKIGTSTWVIERLIEMLNWKSPSEEDIRTCAAQILAKLSGKKQNALRVAGIPGAMESISSLLHTGKRPGAGNADEEASYDFSVFNLLGLKILKHLANDHDNCYKIGNARGLLPKIINLTRTTESLLRDNRAPKSQIKAVKRSLQVVNLLVSTTGKTGKMLRQEISQIVFTVSNIREIIQHGESHMLLQKLGIEILISLAIDENGKEIIGSSGSIIKLLVSIFFRSAITEEESSICNEAGEALALLALESKKNCDRMMKEPALLEQFISALYDPSIQVNASRVLHNLCEYSGTESYERLAGVTIALPHVMSMIMMVKERQLEVSIGLVRQVCKFITPNTFAEALDQARIRDAELVMKLINALKEHNYPDSNVPRIRRFIIEQAIWMMKSDRKYAILFKNYGIETLLEKVDDTASELECFHVFSGEVGIIRYSNSVNFLIETAQELMAMG